MLTQLGAALRAGRQKAVADMPQAALDNLRDASPALCLPYFAKKLCPCVVVTWGYAAAATAQLGLIRGMYGEEAVYQGTLALRVQARLTASCPAGRAEVAA